MDLLAASVAESGAVPLQRRLHFNGAMMELHQRMHAIESSRMAREQQELEAYAAAVMRQQQPQAPQRVAVAAQQQQQLEEEAAAVNTEEEDDEDDEQHQQRGGGSGDGWQAVARVDPIAQRMRRSKQARLAIRRCACRWLHARFRGGTAISSRKTDAPCRALHACCRVMRQRQGRSSEAHSAALAASNAAIVRHAARALIRNCDTLELMMAGFRGHVPPPPPGPATSAAGVAEASSSSGSTRSSSSEKQRLQNLHPRISALLCHPPQYP